MLVYEHFIAKEIAKDFLVDENICLSAGEESEYSVWILKKQGYSTFDAVEIFSDFYGIKTELVGYAGLKDEEGITVQRISTPIGYEQTILAGLQEFNQSNGYGEKTICVFYIGTSDMPVSVGKLNGNAFRLTLRNLQPETAELLINLKKKVLFFPNYYDQQRFGLPGQDKVTHNIGESLLLGDFKKAYEWCCRGGIVVNCEETPESYFEHVDDRKKSFYCNAYASAAFNLELSRKISFLTEMCYSYKIADGLSVNLPFEAQTLVDKELLGQYTAIDRYDVPNFRVPRKSKRENAISTSMRFSNLKPDELHQNRFCIVIEFDLPMGCYATIALRQLDVMLRRPNEKVNSTSN